VAVLAAVNGTGPFATESLLQKMVTLQVFNVFLTLASFVLAAYVEAREREQRARLESRTKSEFLRVAAHELRSPLSVLAGYLSLLSGGDLGEPPRRWKEPLDILNAKTHELNDIMDELLEVSRLDGDVMVPAREAVDLRLLIESAADRAKARAALAGGDVSVDVSAETEVVADVDSGQIAHLLDNLVNNSVAYAHRPPHITITLAREGRRAVIRVSDNASGIPPSMRDAIFEPFRRGRQPGFEEVPGTGLGLYISRELARAHGGDLVLESSTPGEGSTFAIVLPLRVTEAAVRA
jgi:signal transduction histidine kinase